MAGDFFPLFLQCFMLLARSLFSKVALCLTNIFVTKRIFAKMLKNKNFVVYVTRPQNQDPNCFIFNIYDLSTGFRSSQVTQDLMKFLDNPPEFYKTSVKAIIFNSDGFKNDRILDYKLYDYVITKLNLHKISLQFIPNSHILSMCQLIAAKVDPKKDKIVYQFFVSPVAILVKKLVYNNIGYVIDREYPIIIYDKLQLDSPGPFKAIVSSCVPNDPSSQMIKLLQSLKNPIILKEPPNKYFFEAIKIIVNQMYDGSRSISPYYILPRCSYMFWIRDSCKRPYHINENPLISTLPYEVLPITKSCIVSRSHKTFYITSTTKRPFQPYKVTTDCHRIKLTLTVDVNEIPTINLEAVILPRIQNMPKILNVENTEKLPIIGFFDNFSVICLWSEKGNRYKFLESWNGKYGKDLILDFMFPKPKIAVSVTEVTSLSAAAYDLIKIMSMPSNDIKIDPKWKFTFTKDAENPVLLEFDTSENDRKAASPAFLMALMLKQHIKVIRKETGEKPAKIGIRLLNHFENAEAKKRVEAGLKEACEMLKLECLFI